MEVDIFSHNYRFYGKTDESGKPTLEETTRAMIGYQYMPIIEHISNKIKYQDTVDRNYISTNDMEGFEDYRSELILAQNPEHMKDLKRALSSNLKRRRTLAKSSILQQFGAGLFDPVNFVALPFGGPSISIARSALRTGTSIAGIQAVQESYRAPVDPLATGTESVLNIASAFAGGALLGTAFSIPASRRANAVRSTTKQLEELEIAFNPILDPKRPAATSDRPFSQFENIQLEAVIDGAPKTIKALQKLEKELTAKRKQIQSEIKNKPIESVLKDKEKELVILDGQLNGVKKSLDDNNRNMSLADSERITRITEEANKGIADPFGIARSPWTDSVFYKFVPTPAKRIYQSKSPVDELKRDTALLSGDSGILHNLHKFGMKIGASVYQKSATKNGEWVKVHDTLMGLYQQEYKLGPQMFPDVDVRTATQKIQKFTGKQSKTYYEWITEVNRRRILKEKPKSDAERQAIAQIDEYYKTWSDRLTETGMLGGEKFYTQQVAWRDLQLKGYEKQLVDAQNILDAPSGTYTNKQIQKAQRQVEFKTKRIEELRTKISELEQEQQFLRDSDFMPPNEDVFNPRYWDLDAINADRDRLFNILFDWYKNNPRAFVFDEAQNKYIQKTLSGKTSDIEKRVNDTIDTILGRRDVTQEEQSHFGVGKSKSLRHREIDIPNSLVVDFIETNPINVMKTYNARIAPMYEFNNQFGRPIDDVIEDHRIMMIDKGVDDKQINAHLRDFRHLYERVTGKVLRDPNSWDQTTATVLKDLAMLNYLGTAGLATLPDFAKIMMEHEIGAVAKGLFGVLNDSKVRLSAREARQAGEAIEILQGDAHLRLTEYMNNNPLNNGFMSKARSGFFMLNGLAPMTNIFKRFDAIMRGHTLIDYSMKLTKGLNSDGKPAKITKQEQEYLTRYNIDYDDALKIAESAWEKTEAGLYLPNSSQWTDVKVTQNFREAMNSGIMNTILMGTPADKPIAVDGVFYIPIHVARKFNMTEDPKFKGYARVENGLLGLPFQFMSYSFAAANKITASLAQGQVKNRTVAVLASLGLGYMSLSLKQPDFVMDKMSFSDKLARSFDTSGIASLYSDLFYTAMNTSLAVGGPNIGLGIINPKFPQEENALDALTGIAGAGPSYAVDVSRAVGKILSGEFGEGTYELTGRLPFVTALFWNEQMKEIRQSLGGGRF